MATRLVNLFVKNVAAVDRAANKRTFLVIKSADVKKDDAMTFDDAMFGAHLQHVYMALGERYGALMETIDSIRCSDEADKGAAMKMALTSFVESMQQAIPDMMAEMNTDVEKAKVSGERMAKLKTLLKTLTHIINEGEAMSVEKKTPDMNALQKMAAMFGRMMGADEKVVADFEKAGAGTPTVEIPAEVTTRLAKAEADNAAMATRLEKAEADGAKLRDEIALRKFATEVAEYKGAGLDPEKDATLLKSISENLSKEQADRIRELFKSAAAAASVNKMFGEIGAAGSGTPADSAAAEVEQKVDALVAKSTSMTREDGRRQVFIDNPGLYDRWRNETTVKV